MNKAAQLLGSIKSPAKSKSSRENGAKGGRPTGPMFTVEVYRDFASVKHNASGNGLDVYRGGEIIDWQDNNGIQANLSRSTIKMAINAGKRALK